ATGHRQTTSGHPDLLVPARRFPSSPPIPPSPLPGIGAGAIPLPPTWGQTTPVFLSSLSPRHLPATSRSAPSLAAPLPRPSSPGCAPPLHHPLAQTPHRSRTDHRIETSSWYAPIR